MEPPAEPVRVHRRPWYSPTPPNPGNTTPPCGHVSTTPKCSPNRVHPEIRIPYSDWELRNRHRPLVRATKARTSGQPAHHRWPRRVMMCILPAVMSISTERRTQRARDRWASVWLQPPDRRCRLDFPSPPLSVGRARSNATGTPSFARDRSSVLSLIFPHSKVSRNPRTNQYMPVPPVSRWGFLIQFRKGRISCCGDIGDWGADISGGCDGDWALRLRADPARHD